MSIKQFSYNSQNAIFFSFSQHQFYHNHEIEPSMSFQLRNLLSQLNEFNVFFIIFRTFIVKDLKQLVAETLSHTRD